jgi:hypothetical protein
MALLDSIKKLFKGKGKAVSGGIDKAADFADDKTGGKFSEKIDDAADKAKDIVDKLDG